MRLVCKKCGFQHEAAEKRQRCPYCGDKNSLELLKDAGELLDEVN